MTRALGTDDLEEILSRFESTSPFEVREVCRYISIYGCHCEVALDQREGKIFGEAVRFINFNGTRWLHYKYDCQTKTFRCPVGEWVLLNALVVILFPELCSKQVDNKVATDTREGQETLQMRRHDFNANPAIKRRTLRQK